MQPAATLQEILKAIEVVLAEGDLNSQQLTFVQHIRQTSQHLYQKTVDIPPSEIALKRILPTLGDNFIQQQTVIFGYARMLLEMPSSFAGAVLNPKQAIAMQEIYQKAYALMQFCEETRSKSFAERQAQRKTPASQMNLQELLTNYAPILHYFLQDSPTQLSIEIPLLPFVSANPYHLSATIEHIILTMANELIEYGQIKVSASPLAEFIDLRIFCTGIALSHDEIAILFEKQGRQLYRKRFEEAGGKVDFSRELGHGATVHLLLPYAQAEH